MRVGQLNKSFWPIWLNLRSFKNFYPAHLQEIFHKLNSSKSINFRPNDDYFTAILLGYNLGRFETIMVLFWSNLTWSLWRREILMDLDSHPLASNYCSVFFAICWQPKHKRYKNLKGVKGNFFKERSLEEGHPRKQRGRGSIPAGIWHFSSVISF